VFVYTYLYLLYRFFLSLTVLILCTRVQSVVHVYVYMSYFFVDFLLISHTGFLLICHIGSPKRGPGERGGKRRKEEERGGGKAARSHTDYRQSYRSSPGVGRRGGGGDGGGGRVIVGGKLAELPLANARERERERERAVLRLTFIHVTDETLAVNRANYGSCARPRYPGVEDEFRRATCLRETHPYPSWL